MQNFANRTNTYVHDSLNTNISRSALETSGFTELSENTSEVKTPFVLSLYFRHLEQQNSQKDCFAIHCKTTNTFFFECPNKKLWIAKVTKATNKVLRKYEIPIVSVQCVQLE